MSQRKGIFTAVRAAAVALTIGGGALMGHSGIDSARAATTADSPAGSPALTAPAVTSTECDRSKSDDKAKPEVTDQANPAEKDSDTDKPDKDKDRSDDDKDKKDKADGDKDRKDHETCTTSSSSSAGGVSVPVPLPVPPALPPTGSGTKAASAKAPVTGVPKTGSEVPFVAGLLLTTAGAGALIAGRRRRRSE
ncbi:MAG TPA: hypothetical protein VGP96_01090 [Candidatus Dormibacteraeota bacterium]|nr:hypothetical protein [Candidatus Dormibacteraeota bacterium]